MKKLLNSRLFAIISLILLVYCLSILIEKRISFDYSFDYSFDSFDSSFDYRLWSPYYLIFVFLIPISILLPLKLFPTSKYSKFIFQKERELKTITIVIAGILIFWLLIWYGMIGIGKLFDAALHESEAYETSLTYVKNDSVVNSKIGSFIKLEDLSYTISTTRAEYNYIVHGTSSDINIVVILSRNESWIVDTLIIKDPLE